MTSEELEGYLAACGLRLDYRHEHEGYRWLVSRTEDAMPVAQGSAATETAMIAHVLATPYQNSGVLLGQVRFFFIGELHGHDD